MIRPGRLDDVPAILEMGHEFFDAVGWPEVAEWNEPSVTQTVSAIIGGQMPGGLLVHDDGNGPTGMLGFMTFPFYFNFSLKVAQEIFWWVKPSQRGVGATLLDAFEEAGQAQGASVFIVSSVARMKNEALTRFYERRGYAPAENTFIRKL